MTTCCPCHGRPAIVPAALSVEDAATYLGISRNTVYRLSAECGTRVPELRPVHIGGRRLFRRIDLDAFLEAHLVPPAKEVRPRG
jgi:excisionase family DNA binding protein